MASVEAELGIIFRQAERHAHRTAAKLSIELKPAGQAANLLLAKSGARQREIAIASASVRRVSASTS